MSENIFRAFIDNDNRNISISLKKIFFIYSKNLKRKKLYYFMKFYKNTVLSRFKGSRGIQWVNNRKIYNKLYNDYSIRNLKKENMKKNHFYSQSELYPFSPLINQSGYTTSFTPNNKINTPRSSRYNSYRRSNPINQNWDPNSEYIPLWRRNTLTEGNLYGNKNPNKFKDNNFFINNDFNNNDNILRGYPSDYLYNSKFIKPSYSNKNMLNRTDYGFFNPNSNSKNKRNNRNRNIYSNKDDEINNQISQYLNNFRDNNNKLPGFSPKKRTKSSNKFNKGNQFDISGQMKDNENPYNTNIDNYFNKKGGKKNANSINKNNTRNKSKKNKEENNKKIYNDSKEYFYTFSKENNKNGTKNNKDSKKNSNASLNPSSLGAKTFYTNRPMTTNNNLNTGNGVLSNINSASSRMLDTQYHFLNGLRMASGEVNEYFYDFNSSRSGKNDDQKTTQSLQSLSDSKMLELANYYINEEDDSAENYRMNNVVYNKMHNINY